MGADIHIHAFKRNEVLATDMAHGMRNYEWFDALSGRNPTDFDESYIFFPDPCNRIDVKEICPKMDEIIENDINNGGFYGLNIYKLRDLIVWAESYKPNLKAGWVTRWEKWAYENKNIPLSFPLEKTKWENDACWIEVSDYDPTIELILKPLEAHKDDEAFVVIYFDR